MRDESPHLHRQERHPHGLEELPGLRLSVVVLEVVEAKYGGDHHVVKLAYFWIEQKKKNYTSSRIIAAVEAVASEAVASAAVAAAAVVDSHT